jgi:hypothetical protein
MLKRSAVDPLRLPPRDVAFGLPSVLGVTKAAAAAAALQKERYKSATGLTGLVKRIIPNATANTA